MTEVEPISGASTVLPVAGGSLAVSCTATGASGRLVARSLGLRPQTTIGGRLTIAPTPAGERWTRRFGGSEWSTTITGHADDTICERVGPLALHFTVERDGDGQTVTTLRDVRFRGRRMPLPRHVTATARIAPNGNTTVRLVVPGGSCAYHVEIGGAR